MESENAVIGDMTPIELPETQIDAFSLDEEKKMARFSKTNEYKKLKEYIEARIVFYQHNLPGGDEVGLKATPTAEDWMVANRVIGELRAITQAYEAANEVLKNANRTEL